MMKIEKLKKNKDKTTNEEEINKRYDFLKKVWELNSNNN